MGLDLRTPTGGGVACPSLNKKEVLTRLGGVSEGVAEGGD